MIFLKAVIFLAIASISGCGGGQSASVGQIDRPLEYGASLIQQDGITISTCGHASGAICSLTYRGFEYVDSNDMGRFIQSAVNYKTDSGPESYNPTESGNRLGDKSLLVSYHAKNNTISSTVQMAYFLEPGGCNGISCATNTTVLSETYHRKTVAIVSGQIEYTTSFTVQSDIKDGTQVQYQVIAAHLNGNLSHLYYKTPIGFVEFRDPIDSEHYLLTGPLIAASGDSRHAFMLVYDQSKADRRQVFKYAKSAASTHGKGTMVLFDTKVTKNHFSEDSTFYDTILVGTLAEVIQQYEAIYDYQTQNAQRSLDQSMGCSRQGIFSIYCGWVNIAIWKNH